MCYIVYSKVLLAPLICQAVTGVPHFTERYVGFYIADPSSPKTCSVSDTTYHEGEDWHEDACTHCQCSFGQKVCTQQVCSISCVNPVKKPGVCCPICPGGFFFFNLVAYSGSIVSETEVLCISGMSLLLLSALQYIQ